MRILGLRRRRVTPEFVGLVRKFFYVALSAFAVICIQGILLWLFDHDTKSRTQNQLEGIYLIILAIFGEMTVPSSVGARIVIAIALFEGILVGAYVVVVAAVFNLRGGSILMTVNDDHVVICGWNFQGGTIVRELLRGGDFDIVVIPGSEKPDKAEVADRRVRVVDGLPTEDDVLDAANIERARSAIILTDPKLRPIDADAKTLMVVLAIEFKNTDVYTCAQIMDSANRIHLEHANVNEVILMDVLGANLAVAAAINPGISRVVGELLTFNEGSEFYRIDPLPELFSQKSFDEAASICRAQHMILIAVETGSRDRIPHALPSRDKALEQIEKAGRTVLVNPDNYVIGQGDALFVICNEPPRLAGLST